MLRAGTVSNGVFQRRQPGGPIIHRPTHQLVHLGRLSALTDEINAAVVSSVRLLTNYQL